MSAAPVPMYDPQGVLRDIPFDSMKDAVAHGGIPAHPVQAPDGTIRMVPVNRLQEAMQNGGKVLPLNDEQKNLPAAYGFTLSNIGKNLWEGAKGAAIGAYALGKDIVQNPNWFEGENSTANKFLFKPSDEQAAKAKDLWNQGKYSESMGHGLASIVPFAGPAAANLGEQAGAGDVGGALAKGIGQVAPAIAISSAPKVIEKVAAPISERMYQSALKPSTTINPDTVKTMVNTGLQNSIPVSEAGAEKLGGLIDDLNHKISDQIKYGAQQGATINKFQVASRLSGTAKQFSTQVNPEADLNAISDSGNEFLRNQPGEIPADQAQALKKGTYQQLKSRNYGELRSATIEAQKALARGIKEELNTQFPELKDLNAQDSKFYQLDDVLEKAVQRQSNHQLIGLGTPAAAAAGGVLTGTGAGAVAAGILKAVIDDPVMKSRLAIALSKAGKSSVTSAAARIGAYSTALGAASQPASGQPNGQ